MLQLFCSGLFSCYTNRLLPAGILLPLMPGLHIRSNTVHIICFTIGLCCVFMSKRHLRIVGFTRHFQETDIVFISYLYLNTKQISIKKPQTRKKTNPQKPYGQEGTLYDECKAVLDKVLENTAQCALGNISVQAEEWPMKFIRFYPTLAL